MLSENWHSLFVKEQNLLFLPRLSVEGLRNFRQNVAALLTVLLPQLDLTGISLESNTIENVLQQVIDVNSLKEQSELDV